MTTPGEKFMMQFYSTITSFYPTLLNAISQPDISVSISSVLSYELSGATLRPSCWHHFLGGHQHCLSSSVRSCREVGLMGKMTPDMGQGQTRQPTTKNWEERERKRAARISSLFVTVFVPNSKTFWTFNLEFLPFFLLLAVTLLHSQLLISYFTGPDSRWER